MTAFLAGLVIGLACAMWIRWDQVQTLKEELAAHERHNNSRQWRGLYPKPDDKVDQ